MNDLWAVSVPIDAVQLEARAASFCTRSIKGATKAQALEQTIRLMDLTTLEGADTVGKVQALCRKARQPLAGSTLPAVAAVCVYPTLVATACQALAGSSVKVASVATAFPSGQSFLSVRLQEIHAAVAAGAAEIDMVIQRGTFLQGDLDGVYQEIGACKTACAAAHLKVILETGELETYDAVRRASEVAIAAGADFIKTSTGKVHPAATMPVTLVMLEAVRDHYLRTGQRVGIKPAGGIRTAKQAWHYLVMVQETLGADWLQPNLFRLGASSLLNDVLMQWQKLQTGCYQAGHYFSVD